MTVKMESKRRLFISGVLIFGLLVLTVHYPPVFLAVFSSGVLQLVDFQDPLSQMPLPGLASRIQRENTSQDLDLPA